MKSPFNLDLGLSLTGDEICSLTFWGTNLTVYKSLSKILLYSIFTSQLNINF